MDTVTVIGIIASILSAAALVPQLIKILREKKSGDISIAMLICLFLGLSCWVYYGLLQNDIIIVVSNSFSVCINVLITIFTIVYRQKVNR